MQMSKHLELAALTLYFSPLFAFPSAGAVDKLVLPEGMQSVDFESCWRIAGNAES